MIGKGIFKVDDYNRFGSFIDGLLERGVKYVAYKGDEDLVYVWIGKFDVGPVEEFLRNFDIVERRVLRSVVLFKVKWR